MARVLPLDSGSQSPKDSQLALTVPFPAYESAAEGSQNDTTGVAATLIAKTVCAERQLWDVVRPPLGSEAESSSKYTLPSDDVREIVTDPCGVCDREIIPPPAKKFSLNPSSFAGLKLKRFAKRMTIDKFRAAFQSLRDLGKSPKSSPPPSSVGDVEDEEQRRREKGKQRADFSMPSVVQPETFLRSDCSRSSHSSGAVADSCSSPRSDPYTSCPCTYDPSLDSISLTSCSDDESSILSILDRYGSWGASVSSEADPFPSPLTCLVGARERGLNEGEIAWFAARLKYALETCIYYGLNTSICDLCRQWMDLRQMPARFSYLCQRGFSDYIKEPYSGTADTVISFYPGEGGPTFLHNPLRQLPPILDATVAEEEFDDPHGTYAWKASIYERLALAFEHKHRHIHPCGMPPIPQSRARMGLRYPVSALVAYSQHRRLTIDENILAHEFARYYDEQLNVAHLSSIDDDDGDGRERVFQDNVSYSWIPQRREDMSDADSSFRTVGTTSVYSGTRAATEERERAAAVASKGEGAKKAGWLGKKAMKQLRLKEKKKWKEEKKQRRKEQKDEKRELKKRGQQKPARFKAWTRMLQSDPRYILLGGSVAMLRMLFTMSGSV